MTTQPSSSIASQHGDSGGQSPDEYQSVNVPAVFGLVLGGLSILALLGPFLWMFPLAGLMLNGRTLLGMARSAEAQAGRGIASLGLFLSVLFGVAGPVDYWGGRWLLQQSASPVADAWIAALRSQQPQRALQLATLPALRQPPDADLLNFYRTHRDAHEQLNNYVADPVVKTLLLLGERAEVRLYETNAPIADDHRDLLGRVYAVSFDDQGTKTTFFFAMTLERRYAGTQQGAWRIINTVGGVHPHTEPD